jgi:hypothetical protein
MQINTNAGTWVVPTTRAIWIPPEHTHSIEMRSAVVMATLYVANVLVSRPTNTGTLTALDKDSGAVLRTIQRICMQHALVLLHELPNVTVRRNS